MPDVFWQKISITNIVYAVCGYCQDKGILMIPEQLNIPNRAFLEEMLKKVT
jgi:hypothetical protein